MSKSKIKSSLLVLAAVSTLCVGVALAQSSTPTPNSGGPATVGVAWNPNPEPNIAKYRLYYGRAPAITEVVEVAPSQSPQVTIPGLDPSVPWVFIATAVNDVGLESPPSESLTVTWPGQVRGLKLSSAIRTLIEIFTPSAP